ncbi:IclR family transcriptional regulator domain-containing protein [Actinomycetospora soli]|uniref:IclR family transcriptional regulator domain-containing protein n=1 Tax=Actinomycetospora soli TaxID=2893887 RepID=UPI001E60103A|nr:IclR family transcriptional regulator C-terminal domain-containing protein [Actinomycetospora soli]MCD2191572.1 helix-turn-helix domain-containing protein [Actinomycetospora soli]
MAGLGKGLAVIEAFGARSSRLTVSEAAEITGTTRAAARRCLLTLVELGYVAHDGKHFRPTPRMLRLGSSYLEADPLPALAQPHLVEARDEMQESVSLAVLEDGWSVFVARAEIAHLVSTGVRVGARLPGYCSATGRVLLAGLDDEEARNALRAEPRRARTSRTLTDPAALFAVVLETRERGYALIDEELELGMRALAVPVRTSRGNLVAAMSVSASSGRVTNEELRTRLLPVLLERAAALSKTL